VVKETDEVILVALSGMKSREDVMLYEPLPVVRGILVGEHLMKCGAFTSCFGFGVNCVHIEVVLCGVF
jgi:indole-3-glycerol phosphate synthase